MPIDDRTTNRSYKLPNAGNFLADDVARLRDALTAIDADVFARYTKAEADQKLADLINGAPGALDTLNELAAAMGDDPNFAATITNALAGKPGFADVWTRTQADARYVQGVTQTENVFTGTGSQTTFALTQTPPSRESILVSVDGVVQPTTAYNLSGSALILSEAPASGASIRVLMLGVAGPVQSASTLNFTQAGAGAVTRTVDSKLKDVVNVKDFGAVGDGAANDTAAIQAALNTGKDVWIPEQQTFMVNSPLLFKAHGQTVILNGTVKASSAMVAVFQSTDFDRVGFVGNGTVDGNSLTTNCVKFIADARNPTGVFTDGITVQGSANDPTLYYGGILVVNTGGKAGTYRHKDVFIRNTTARNCGTHGVLIAYADGVAVENCLFDTCTNHGHESVNCSDVRIVGNTAQSCVISGLGVGDNTINWVISGNVVRNCGGDGSITCEHNSVHGVISNNTIIDANTSGINISYGTPGAAPFDRLQGITCSGNVIKQKAGITTYIGINYYSSTGAGIGRGVQVTSNVIDGFNVGITYAYSSYGSISDNSIINLVGSNSAAIKATLVSKLAIENNSCNTDTGDHTYQILSYSGSHSSHVNVRGNHAFASGGAAKSLVYIEGPNQFDVTANNTFGSKHYVECSSTAVVNVGSNYGNLAAAPYSGGTLYSHLGSAAGTTVGAAGAASALPANPLGYVTVFVPFVGNVKVPYYNL